MSENGEWAIVSFSPTEIIDGNDLKLSKKYNNFVVKGTMPILNHSDTYKIIAEFKGDPEYGDYHDLIFINAEYELTDPVERHRFLDTVLTPSQVERLYKSAHDPFSLIGNEDIEALTKIDGIGTKTAVSLIEKFKTSIDYSKAYVKLHEVGLTKQMIDKLVENYKSIDTLIDKLKTDPYVLADEINGIGFKKADALAVNMGLERTDVKRVLAFIKYFLHNQAQEGNSWVHVDTLYTQLIENVGEDLPDENFGQAMRQLHNEKEIWWDDNKTHIALYFYYQLEYNISVELKRIIGAKKTIEYPNDITSVLLEIEGQQGWNFTDEQINAVKGALENNISIITGSGGTGKSSSVKAVVELLKQSGCIVTQTALSGRAASRLAEITGDEGFTIHRLLAYNPHSGFEYTKQNQMPVDIVVLDECSMVGGDLFYSLIQAIRSGSKLIILGDEGQLESIGTLNLFKDMIESGVIPVYRLTKIHRQAQKSAIITESIKIRQQKQLIPMGWTGKETRGELQDLVLDIHSESIYTAPKILEHFEQELKRLKDITKILCVVPTRFIGDACVYEMNNDMQQIYNPPNNRKREVVMSLTYKSGQRPFILREGDKIIICKNEYKKTLDENGQPKPVFNGNIGILEDIGANNTLTVNLDGIGTVYIPSKSKNIVQLGYAITTHKGQGSEFDTVIVGMDFSGYTLLSKEWLYTSVTRAKSKCILCAETKSLKYAIETSKVPHKQTFLVKMLRNEL